MKIRKVLAMFALVAVGLFSTSCRLPGMLPLPDESAESAGPMPIMEKDTDKVLEVLRGGDYVRLEMLAEEKYTEADFNKPGTLTFTVNKLTNDKPVYFNYGWCTTTEEILRQNFEHIKVGLYFNDDELGRDVVHPIAFTRSDGMVCLDLGVLLSDWPAGQYKLKTVATFDEKINDGIADFEAGEYAFEYAVEVQP